MTVFEPTLAAKVAKLMRLLASDKPGEIVAAFAALRRTLHSAGADLHELAAVIERSAIGAEETTPPKVTPSSQRWHDIACFCAAHLSHLDEKHHDFVRNMKAKTLLEEPSEKQARYLKNLFAQLAGCEVPT